MKDKMDKWVEKARTAIKWVAVDSDGEIYGYTEQPVLVGEAWWKKSEGCENIYLGPTRDVELIKNWDKSLRRVEYGK